MLVPPLDYFSNLDSASSNRLSLVKAKGPGKNAMHREVDYLLFTSCGNQTSPLVDIRVPVRLSNALVCLFFFHFFFEIGLILFAYGVIDGSSISVRQWEALEATK